MILLTLFSTMIGWTAFDRPTQYPTAIADLPPFQFNQCKVENSAFQDGEEMVFKVYYNWNFVWMSAGEVVFKVDDQGDRYHISAIGTTYKAYDPFFKIRDRYDAYVDKNTMLPITSSRDVHEGHYRLYDKLTFDRQHKIVKSFRGDTRDVATTTEYPIDECIQDILSLLYSARNLNVEQMKPGQDFGIKIFMDKETWPLKVNYRGHFPNKKIRGLGKFNTIAFNPEVIKGYIFKEDSNLIMWISDDKNRVPLMIESPISIGSVKVILKSYKGLRYEMTSRLKDHPAEKKDDTEEGDN